MEQEFEFKIVEAGREYIDDYVDLTYIHYFELNQVETNRESHLKGMNSLNDFIENGCTSLGKPYVVIFCNKQAETNIIFCNKIKYWWVKVTNLILS